MRSDAISHTGSNVVAARRTSLWGFRVTPLTIAETVSLIESSWANAERCTILYQNLHTLYVQSADERYQRSFDDAVALIDGAPLIRLLQWTGHDIDHQHRVVALDLIHPVLAAAVSTGKRVFVIGQQEGVLVDAISQLRSAHPGLEIAGHHGFFDLNGPGADHVVAQANDFGADLVLMGLGSPKTEIWIDQHRDRFDASVVWVCGALMEYVSGVVPTPPRWSGEMGVEWAFRLASDPKRFFWRYVGEPFVLVGRVLLRRLRKR